MVCADAAVCIVQAGIRPLLQKDGTLSIGEEVCERTPAKSEPAGPLVSVPAPVCRSARGDASSLKSSVLCRNESYMSYARAVSPEEGNSLKWLGREWGGDRRSCLSTSTGNAASGISVMAGGHSEGFVQVVFMQQVWPERGTFHLAKLSHRCHLTPKQLICSLHKRLWFEMLKTAILYVHLCV